MARNKMVDGVLMPYTAEEESRADIVEKAWADGASAREMVSIRNHRDNLLAETDWTGNPDVTMSNDMKTYRQALRDLPAGKDTVAKCTNATWPTKP